MGSNKQRSVIVVEVSATTTSQWFSLDYRYGEMIERPFFMTLASAENDSWTIQVGASVPSSAADTITHTADVSTYTGVTADNGVLHGNWPAVRFIYSGTGDAKLVMVE